MLKSVLEFGPLIAATLAAFWAAWTYKESVKLQRAKWMKELYEKFYESDGLRETRDKLDGGGATKISELVQRESSDFTDYLNFFEFLGYLHESGQIKLDEIVGLFDYYLRSLKANADIKTYIDDPSKGFEKLRKLLNHYQ